MSLEHKKPIEPIIVLIGAIILIIVGLTFKFVSFRVLGLNLKGYEGYKIQEALYPYLLSVVFIIMAIIIYYYGDDTKARTFSRNLLIIGTLPGLIGAILVYTGHSQARGYFINFVLANAQNATLADAKQAANLLSPDIGFWMSFTGLILMGISAYMLSVSKFSFVGLRKEDTLLPDLNNSELTDQFTLDGLKRLWYCPNDNTKLMGIGSRIVPNPEFRVSRERMDDNINNAVAMRKINPELSPYAKSLAELLFRNSDKQDIDLVSTQCATCHKHYISPKLSEWLN